MVSVIGSVLGVGALGSIVSVIGSVLGVGALGSIVSVTGFIFDGGGVIESDTPASTPDSIIVSPPLVTTSALADKLPAIKNSPETVIKLKTFTFDINFPSFLKYYIYRCTMYTRNLKLVCT